MTTKVADEDHKMADSATTFIMISFYGNHGFELWTWASWLLEATSVRQLPSSEGKMAASSEISGENSTSNVLCLKPTAYLNETLQNL